jgi:L-lactate dehydrogenase complex protein LldG
MKMNEVDENLYERFKAKATALTVQVVRAAAPGEAASLIIREIKKLQVQKVASAPLRMIDAKALEKEALLAGLEFSTQLSKEEIEQADLGISEFDLGIAELGTLCQDASSLHTRLVSMLPPIHLALLSTASLVESFAQALELLEKTYKGQIPPYLSFITGPSKTADIERELTIGVHGPGKLIILCLDPTPQTPGMPLPEVK